MHLTWKQRLSGWVEDASPATTGVLSPPATAAASPAPLTYSSITFDHWQRSEPHMAYVRELFRQPMFRDLLAVLQNARPQAVGVSVTDTTAAIALGRREGFDMLLGLLLRLPIAPPEPTEEVPATYGSEQFDLNRVT